MCSNSCKLNNAEKDELESLRKEVRILKDLCLPEKFKNIFVSAWYAAKLAVDEDKFSVKTMEDVYLQIVEDTIQEELENLEKD
jgi:folate-dependent tRNA-U54 methylase TrmFO/GidA